MREATVAQDMIMKLEFKCWQCPEGTPGRRVTEPFNESGSYSFKCAQGHVHDIVLVQIRFEVLAETGMQALVDGYYREAITSFAASLERIYQFYIDVVTLSADVDAAIHAKTWKLVSRQSERQLGMFIALYQVENKAEPPLLADMHTALRNRVVHQGYLPTEAEAIGFAQAVLDLAQPLLNAMMPRYTATIERLLNDHTEKASAGMRPVGRLSLVFFEFILKFDTEADDWNPAATDIRAELALRRSRALTD